MEQRKRVYFPSAVERLRRMTASLGEFTGSKEPAADLPGLIDEISELPDNRLRPLLMMELVNAIHDRSIAPEDRSQIVVALIIPNNAEGMRLHLGARGYGRHLALLCAFVERELSVLDTTAVYVHRLTEYECAVVVLGSSVEAVRQRIECAENAARVEWNRHTFEKINRPAGNMYYPKVKDTAFLWNVADMRNVVTAGDLFHRCRLELHRKFPFRIPPLIPSSSPKKIDNGFDSLHGIFLKAAEKWIENGRPDSELVRGTDLVTFVCWLNSPGMVHYGCDPLLRLFKSKSQEKHDDDFMRILNQRENCACCGESFVLDNLRFCVQCRETYCVPCSSPFPLTLFNNPECPECGNEVVG